MSPPRPISQNDSDGEALLAALVASSEDPILSKTLDGVVTSWNAAAERMFGYSAEEMVGSSLRKIIPAMRHAEEDDILRRVAAGERVRIYDTTRIRKDGAPIEVSLNVSPILSRAGNIVGASNILRDITERKAAEKQISTLSQEIAHRTKNLLSVVQAIVRQTSSVGDRDTLVQRLMERLSAFAATHELVVASDWAAVDLGALVQSQLGHFKDLFGSRINIQGRPLQINAAAAQNIGMAIHELATNASKYGALSKNGKVEIDWGFADEGGDFRLEWRESGGPPVKMPTRRGFGATITALAGSSVSGASSTKFDPAGITWTLVAPLENVRAR